MIELNQVTYGNPSIDEKQLIETPFYLDALFNVLKQTPFAFNDSELVKDELNELVDFTRSMEAPENAEYLKLYRAMDRNLLQFIAATFKNKGLDTEQLCMDIARDIEPLIVKLKYFYQRPRPAQLAQYYRLSMFPFRSFGANSPSYPSRHSVQAGVILSVIASTHPTLYRSCKEMIQQVYNSRRYMGVSFQSDIYFSKQVVASILKSPEFSKKYRI